MTDNDGISIKDGIPAVSVPPEILAKYAEYFQSCLDVNKKIRAEGTVEEIEALVTITGQLFGYSMAVLKDPFTCVNDDPA